jgi:hypothetical protein
MDIDNGVSLAHRIFFAPAGYEYEAAFSHGINFGNK